MGVYRAGFKVPMQRPTQRAERLGAPGCGRFQINLAVGRNRFARSGKRAFPQIRGKGWIEKNQMQTARYSVP